MYGAVPYIDVNNNFILLTGWLNVNVYENGCRGIPVPRVTVLGWDVILQDAIKLASNAKFPVPLAVTVTPLYTRLPPGKGSFPIQLLLAADGDGVGVGVLVGVILGDTVIDGVIVGVTDTEVDWDGNIIFGWNETLQQLGTCEAPPTVLPILFIKVVL